MASTLLHMGPAPVIGGNASPILKSKTLRQLDVRLTHLLVVYEDSTTVRTPSTSDRMARRPGDYPTDGGTIVKLAPAILKSFHVTTQARTVERGSLSALLAENARHERLPVLILKDTGT